MSASPTFCPSLNTKNNNNASSIERDDIIDNHLVRLTFSDHLFGRSEELACLKSIYRGLLSSKNHQKRPLLQDNDHHRKQSSMEPIQEKDKGESGCNATDHSLSNKDSVSSSDKLQHHNTSSQHASVGGENEAKSLGENSQPTNPTTETAEPIMAMATSTKRIQEQPSVIPGTIDMKSSRREDHCPQLVLLSGYSGTGKSALAESFFKDVIVTTTMERQITNSAVTSSETINKNVPIVTGKFEDLQGAHRPFSAISDGFSRYCDTLMLDQASKSSKEGIKRASTIRTRIREALGHEANLLTAIIGTLAHVLNPTGPTDEAHSTVQPFSSNSLEDWNRFTYVFIKFLRVLCHPDRPLVLHLDDVQWADQASIDLLKCIMMDDSLEYLMVIASFRSNEVSLEHPFSVACQSLRRVLPHDRIHTIELTGLTRLEVAQFLAAALDMPVDDTCHLDPLVDVLYAKTEGNIFYTRQALQDLVRQKLIFKSLTTWKWEWNLDLIQNGIGLSNNVIDVVKGSLSTLPKQVQRILITASYLRSTFSSPTLHAILVQHGELENTTTVEALEDLLEMAVVEGFLLNSVGSDVYSFSHDQIKEAFSLSISQEEVISLKKQIGKILITLGNSDSGMEWMLFVACDHLNAIDATEIIDPVDLARINYQVGSRAVEVSAFMPASQYLRKGIEYLLEVPRHWESNHYELSLGLYQSSAAVEVCLGNFEQAKAFCDKILEKAHSPEVKSRSLQVLSRGYGNLNNQAEAYRLQLKAIEGIKSFPKRFQAVHLLGDLVRIRRLMKKHSDYDIMMLPVAKDKGKLLSAQIMSEMGPRAFQNGDVIAMALTLIRLVIDGFKYGASPDFAEGLAGYGLIVCGLFNDMNQALRLSRLSRLLLEERHDFDESRSKHVRCNVLLTTNNFIESWAVPIPQLFESYRTAYLSGLECGDLEHGYFAWASAGSHAFVAGFPLAMVGESMRKLWRHLARYKIVSVAGYVEGFVAATEFLRGDTEIDWTACEEVPQDIPNSDLFKWIIFLFVRLHASYYLGLFKRASSIAKILNPLAGFDSSYHLASPRIFFSGLVAVSMAKTTRKSKFLAQARKFSKEMEKFVRDKGVNIIHRHLILQADISICEMLIKSKKSCLKTIRPVFDPAISVASKAGFAHDAALANELAGTYFVDLGDSDSARDYLTKATILYDEWGASRKVVQLRERFGPYIDESQIQKSVYYSQVHRFTRDECQTISPMILDNWSGRTFVSNASMEGEGLSSADVSELSMPLGVSGAPPPRSRKSTIAVPPSLTNEAHQQRRQAYKILMGFGGKDTNITSASVEEVGAL